ncbi:MAG: PQQ-dependent dehydrogenase, methanol/ethanol family [Pseudomonadales bacterium]|nr:PQQ-dependent dehydrogenase, methanol/ethanol family [Pseudomonadales bacterium]MBO6563146.1 PQQ-dependent dehydrogenase, methanol/ethanol family [Pseudomonadales bacterium]MBO6596905.1 PQQ-dependent dehydrogenase, methanol/ethanol family [Pseudomonadales bacterium]MBO6658227.1 PQQ-dependent dehydrogenase, methanol/ethanol family [Pseudomonadales bacterium]MBO6823106.1 PQQ-dependent dehydrogenase, methanol/ethanol family [Pseudomonadales bacterium]
MPYLILLFALLAESTITHASVSGERIIEADNEPGSWLTHGRNYAEDRMSPLTQINKDNIKDLGLAWYFDTGTTRGLEASPLVIDGVIYTTGSWSKVFANDARTGEELWSYDPEVPRAWGVNACCDVVNRGVAAWENSIFVGTIDGRLVSLNKETGAVEWDVLTIDKERPYTITGAPRVVNGKVLIGNGGAEYGVRGYLSGYDARTGDLSWRFFTVPGHPADEHESDVMRMAAETWTGNVYHQVGGGGTAWDSMAYDHEANILYFGVGNGSPWNRHIRSPGGGDNLFLSSIVAINPDNGEYIWHYQTTPADTWDYTATQHIILADLEIKGEMRKVLMQAPKNGFFYVIDRITGELLSAENYVPVTWASHIDMKTGRPVETENADHLAETKTTSPAQFGGHNWHPMAYNAGTGLVYIPAMLNQAPYNTDTNFEYLGGSNWHMGQMADTPEMDIITSIPPGLMSAIFKRMARGKLIAWDPVQQKEVWSVMHETMWNGGVLTTASGLVFQGTGDGRFIAYDAETGKHLWESPTVTGILAPPISYSLDGDQYIALMAGWGGAGPLAMKLPGSKSAGNGRLLVYKLGGEETLPPGRERPPMPVPPAQTGTEASIAEGSVLYHQHCVYCHGAALNSDAIIADLRYMSEGSHQAFQQIVRGGILSGIGMASFAERVTEEEADAIHDYVIYASHQKWDEDQATGWWKDLRDWSYEVIADVVSRFGLM